jgi:methionyl-tRNA formyltransferase
VDAGDIYLQEWFDLAGHELLDQLRDQVAQATLSLCRAFVDEYPDVVHNARPQNGEPSYYPRRGPEDSELDPDKTLAEQFEVLRVVDNEVYPAFFEMRGQRYQLRIEKARRE